MCLSFMPVSSTFTSNDEEIHWFQSAYNSFEPNNTDSIPYFQGVQPKLRGPLHDPVLGNLLRSIDDELDFTAPIKFPEWMKGATHYRLFSGIFPQGMEYHFDGLAVVMSIRFTDKGINVKTKGVGTKAYDDYSNCMFFGTGTGPTLGRNICFQNPVVNLLPVKNQLWLTIDTHAWARIDPSSLATFPKATVDTSESRTFTLNAHPACDPVTSKCFVQHPCSEEEEVLGRAVVDVNASRSEFPQLYTAAVCVSMLDAVEDADGLGSLKTHLLSKTTLRHKKLIQHSHSPCITPNFIVAKLDAFEVKSPGNKGEAGLLKHLRQNSDNLWLVMDRRSNISSVLMSNVKFVNNHFWNCYEEPINNAATAGEEFAGTSDTRIIVESVPATSDYLDAYFKSSFERNGGGFNWTTLQTPQRCIIPTSAVVAGRVINAETDQLGSIAPAIICSSFTASHRSSEPSNSVKRSDYDSKIVAVAADKVPDLLFDYPTFNPLVKMNPNYKFFYAISPKAGTSVWYDRLIKVDSRLQQVVAAWSEDGMFLSEATFLPAGPGVKTGKIGSTSGRSTDRSTHTHEGDPVLVEPLGVSNSSSGADEMNASSDVDEEAGVLISLLYSSKEDASYVALFDPRSMSMIDRVKLPSVVPFNAHGLWCTSSRCYPNP